MPPARSTTPSSNYTPKDVHGEHVTVTLGMAPFRAVQRSYSFLSSVKGSGIIATMLSLYCAGLSIEAVFVATPLATDMLSTTRLSATQREELSRSRRFIPKPYVNDGADLGRLNPLPNIQNAVLQRYFQWLPMWIKGGISSDYWTVWNAPGVLTLSVVVALMIQRYEGLIWRKKDPTDTRAEFQTANAQKKVQADPNAIALAAYKAQQHNSQGTGGVVGTFIAVVLLYGLEIAAFVGSFAGAGSFVVNAVYAGLTICGFEVFDRMAEDARTKK